MNNRLSIPDIAALLVEYTGKDKKKAELFLKEFIAVVTEGVFRDKLVKINGIGTFKIIQVEKRESIHVNTGERIVIPEHYKFSFTPDKDLREEVNKPFSLFETIEINNDVDFSEIDRKYEKSEIKTDAISESIPETIQEPQTIIPEETPVIGTPIVQTIEEVPQNPKEEKSGPLEETESVPELIEPDEVGEGDSSLPTTVEDIHHLMETEQVEIEEELDPVIDEPEQPIVEETVEEKPTVQTKRIDPNYPPRKKTYLRGILSTLLIVLLGVISFMVYLNRNIVFHHDEPATYIDIPDKVEEENQVNSGINNWEAVEEEVILDAEPVQQPTTSNREPLAKLKIEPGSRLTLLALEYYGHKFFWVYIYEHNKSLIHDPNNIPIGTEITIPAPEIYGINAKDRKSIEKAAELQAKILSSE